MYCCVERTAGERNEKTEQHTGQEQRGTILGAATHVHHPSQGEPTPHRVAACRGVYREVDLAAKQERNDRGLRAATWCQVSWGRLSASLRYYRVLTAW